LFPSNWGLLAGAAADGGNEVNFAIFSDFFQQAHACDFAVDGYGQIWLDSAIFDEFIFYPRKQLV